LADCSVVCLVALKADNWVAQRAPHWVVTKAGSKAERLVQQLAVHSAGQKVEVMDARWVVARAAK